MHVLQIYSYNTKWYNMSIATRKLLIMIMMRSKTSVLVTAGKIIIMSYVTFNAVSTVIMSHEKKIFLRI